MRGLFNQKLSGKTSIGNKLLVNVCNYLTHLYNLVPNQIH
jgi:hypothetical protein